MFPICPVIKGGLYRYKQFEIQNIDRQNHMVFQMLQDEPIWLYIKRLNINSTKFIQISIDLLYIYIREIVGLLWFKFTNIIISQFLEITTSFAIQMQTNFSDKYIAIILTEFKSSERDLYPLTKNHPLPLFPIGNKKLIIYQLQALAKVASLQRIVVEVNEANSSIEEYVTKVFLAQFPHFPKKVQFYHTANHQNNFLRLLGCIEHVNKKISPNYKGLLVSLCDTIMSFDINQLVKFHQKRRSNLSMLLKKKKQSCQNQKKIPESQIQTQIDNVFVGQNGEILFIDMLQEYQNNGIKIPPSIYRRVNKGSFRKVVDSKIYVVGREIIQIIKNLNSSQVDDVKPWLIQCLVQNQTNKRLLDLDKNGSQKPLNIFGLLVEQDTFIKKISNKKGYEAINFDSILRGAKQKDLLVPNQYSFNSQTHQYKGSLIMKSSSVGSDSKITRSVVQNDCIIGKKVQILRSIIMGNVQIRDNCKIHDSIIAENTLIGGDCIIISSYLASNCQIPDGSKLDNQLKIPAL